jgi:hypothetical protein
VNYKCEKYFNEIFLYRKKNVISLHFFKKNARETGLEPVTSAVTGRCSNQLNYSRFYNVGRNRTRTYDHLCVRQALYQLSYAPQQLKKKLYNNLIVDFFTSAFLKKMKNRIFFF